jgi:hypothetical protein
MDLEEMWNTPTVPMFMPDPPPKGAQAICTTSTGKITVKPIRDPAQAEWFLRNHHGNVRIELNGEVIGTRAKYPLLNRWYWTLDYSAWKQPPPARKENWSTRLIRYLGEYADMKLSKI